MEEVGSKEIEEYILKRHNTVVQSIATRPILDLFKDMVRMSGLGVAKRCCEQEELDLAGEREAVDEAEAVGHEYIEEE